MGGGGSLIFPQLLAASRLGSAAKSAGPGVLLFLATLELASKIPGSAGGDSWGLRRSREADGMTGCRLEPTSDSCASFPQGPEPWR